MPDETIAVNRRARHDYAIEDTLEAGIVLTGTEIKSVREHRVNIAEAYGSQAGNRRVRFESAHGSLYEAAAAIRIAVAWGYTSADGCMAALTAIDRLGARLYRIAHP